MSVDAAGDNAERDMPQTLGAALAAERERQGLSRADAAQRLHMSPSQVEALERGDYQTLPKGTFLRGFVRNYAKVLGLEPDAMLAMLAEGKPRDPAPHIIVPTQNIRFDPLGERFSSPYVKAATLAVVAVAIAFAAMYWTLFVRPKPPGLAGQTSASRTAPVPAPSVPSPPPPQGEPPAAGETFAPGATAGDMSAPQVPAAAPAKSAAVPPPVRTAAIAAPPQVPDAAAKPAKGGVRKTIHFHFDGDSWVEVRDASGKVLYQRLNPAGSDADIAARPPVDVIVGNAPEVRMSYDGAAFPLEPHTNVAVARFTLE